ncbi:hypothetical protein GCM10007157_34240 [Vreelandella hamiltonii]|uniref:Uncharacterized protein n=1 Tax=Vreelandella hamiltonii TaxID=502829 RepID=A0A8H9I577_9GAMM|nr:hypothetical protein GCM10007157_34240 [Halomonas hamiltonii]
MLLSDRENALSRPSLRLTQQRKNVLRNLVGLCQYGSTSLLQNLRAGHIGDFHRVVGIFNTRTSGSEVSLVGVQVGDGVFETVLDSTQLRTLSVNSSQSSIQFSQRAAAIKLSA